MQLAAKLFIGSICFSSASCAVSAKASRDPTCGEQAVASEVQATRQMVEREMPLLEPTDLFSGNARYACALLEFDINEAGRAVNIRVTSAFPSKIYSEEAKRALEDYQFNASSRNDMKILFRSKADK